MSFYMNILLHVHITTCTYYYMYILLHVRKYESCYHIRGLSGHDCKVAFFKSIKLSTLLKSEII